MFKSYGYRTRDNIVRMKKLNACLNRTDNVRVKKSFYHIDLTVPIVVFYQKYNKKYNSVLFCHAYDFRTILFRVRFVERTISVRFFSCVRFGNAYDLVRFAYGIRTLRIRSRIAIITRESRVHFQFEKSL